MHGAGTDQWQNNGRTGKLNDRAIAINVGIAFLYTSSAFFTGVFAEYLPFAVTPGELFATVIGTMFAHLGVLALHDGISNY